MKLLSVLIEGNNSLVNLKTNLHAFKQKFKTIYFVIINILTVQRTKIKLLLLYATKRFLGTAPIDKAIINTDIN